MGSAQSVAVDVRPESARQVTVSLDVVDRPLADVLKAIAWQAGKRTSWNDRVMDATPRISLRVRDVSVDAAFAQALAGTGLRAVVTADRVMFVRDPASASVAQGGIAGKVVDAKTKQGLRGATVMLNGMGTQDVQPRTTTSDDGSFRFSGVVSGSYTVQVRMLGYVRAAKTVTVSEGQTALVEIALEPSVNALDHVVVTGTVVPTELKAIPNAITVVTAKDIEQRGITKIDQLFRGEVPGLFSANIGGANPTDSVSMSSRGATSLAAGIALNNAPIKTYVDGVELADSKWLTQIDPASIERIEILTGPQASTIYGSNAINGVMQVFTKRGTRSTPQLVLSLSSGTIQNNFSHALTPQHDHQGQISGIEGSLSYNAGGSWVYTGPWTPARQMTRTSAFGGMRLQRHAFTADVSIRRSGTKNLAKSNGNQPFIILRSNGTYAPDGNNGASERPIQYVVDGQTLGLTLGYTPFSWWSHELSVGTDHTESESRAGAASYSLSWDSLVNISTSQIERTSLRYTMTARVPINSAINGTVTLGGDQWRNLFNSRAISSTTLTGALTGSASIYRQPSHNAGAFVQGQLGIMDAIFLTYGFRAEWNPDYGEDAQPNVTPRYGVAYTYTVGEVTTKLRVSYGRATRPPSVNQKIARKANDPVFAKSGYIPYYGNFEQQRANAELGPEYQQGGEGGVELYLGNRASLVLTRYNQTVDALILSVFNDSARTLAPNVLSGTNFRCHFIDPAGYCYTLTQQNINVGSLRNQGWEAQGTVTIGPLITKGTYSWNKSRVIGLTQGFTRGQVYTPDSFTLTPGAAFGFMPEHTWAGNITYAARSTTIALVINGIGQLYRGSDALSDAVSPFMRLTSTSRRMELPAGYQAMGGGYATADLNISRRFSNVIEGMLQVQNMANSYQNDYSTSYATIGRQTKMGIRVRTK